MPLHPELAPLLALIDAGIPMHTLSPVEARASFRRLTVESRDPASLPEVASVEETTVAGGAGELPARIYRPVGEDAARATVVLLHGGGYVVGDLDTHEGMARALCAGLDAVVVSVDYRLAPEAPYPAAAQDAIAAVTDVRGRLGELGGSDVLGVAGDSAGGNLAAVASQHVDGIAAQLLVYPATDVLGEYPSRTENGSGFFLDTPTLGWFIDHYAPPGTDLAEPTISPLRGKLDGLPPAVVVTAELDPLRDEGNAYAHALAEAGVTVDLVTYPGLIHGFFDMGAWSPACQQAIDDTIARFARLLSAAR
ncbi:alpha/beta hydrolase [Nocardioides sp. zg-ZUI104]|uniref:alpha/beta hydrolase n=1 Tax=Nocardioides faecalis TaxID=2803858 RepID=UPI001BCDF617|nr:alpha/beta hydrolase [Nocardioides faecalis]MBS4753885.1 alpha/beta hydrolase [Nocardioides faecalis]